MYIHFVNMLRVYSLFMYIFRGVYLPEFGENMESYLSSTLFTPTPLSLVSHLDKNVYKKKGLCIKY